MKKPMFFCFQPGLLLLFVIFLMLPVVSNAQALLTFHFDDIKSWDPTGPWGFDADAPGFVTDDSNCFTYCNTFGYTWHNYAYKFFGPDAVTVSSCEFENMALVADPDDVTIDFQQYNLSGHDKFNTVVGGAPWNIAGQAGDRRTYSDGACIIYHLGVAKLYVDNITFDVTTPYPDQIQMRASHPLFVNWIGDVGSGDAITATGWGDIDMVLSDPQWIAAFAQVNNQVKIAMSSVSYVIQGSVGWYDFDLDVMPAPLQQVNAPAVVPLGQPNIQVVAMVDQDIEFAFDPNVVGGGAAGDMNVLNVKKILVPPLAKAFPPGITETLAQYWDISSTLGSFTCDIIFDLTGLKFSNTADWRILRCDHADWEIYANSEIVDANHIKALNVTDFSEWTIGTVETTLPVELSSFTATVDAENMAVLNWITQSETELAGYRIYRNTNETQNQSVCLTTQAIQAVNTSTGASYSFVDEDVEIMGTYYYWLEALELSGSSQLYGPVKVTINDPDGNDTPEIIQTTELLDAYPNPFKHSNVIHYTLKEPTQVQIEIFNAKGQLIKKASYNHTKAGHYKMTWNALELPEGIYLYRMTTNEYTASKKIILMK